MSSRPRAVEHAFSPLLSDGAADVRQSRRARPVFCSRVCRHGRQRFLSVPDPKDTATIASMMENSARAIALDPALASAHASRGLAFGEPRNRRRLRPNICRPAIDPNLYEANYFYATILPCHGHYDEAASYFERAAEVRPTDYKSLGLLQAVYELLGDRVPRSRRRSLLRGAGRARA